MKNKQAKQQQQNFVTLGEPLKHAMKEAAGMQQPLESPLELRVPPFFQS